MQTILAFDIRSKILQCYDRCDNRDWDAEVEAGKAIYYRYLRGQALLPALQEWLNILHTMITLIPKNPNPLVLRVYDKIAHISRDYLCFEHSQTTSEEIWVRLAAQAEILSEDPSPGNYGFAHHIDNIPWALRSYAALHRWINWLKENTPKDINPEDLAIESQQIWTRVIEDRAYGVKSCFFPSPLLLEGTDVFHVLDPRLGLADSSVLERFSPNRFAIIGHGDKPTRKIRARVETGHERPGAFNRYIRLEQLDYMFTIDNQGNLFSTMERIPLRDFFGTLGGVREYELVRLFLIMRMYDLTARADIVDSLPPIHGFEDNWVTGGRRRRFRYKKLLLPRLKPVEYARGGAGRRFIDRHHVTWFVRPLPSGYQASQAAHALAASYGVRLEPGETIVREHFRGRGEENQKATKAKFAES